MSLAEQQEQERKGEGEVKVPTYYRYSHHRVWSLETGIRNLIFCRVKSVGHEGRTKLFAQLFRSTADVVLV